MKRIIAVVVGLLFLLTGCGDSIGNGDTKIKPAVYGTWHAPNATVDCRWNIRTKKGVTIRSGKGSSPSMTLGPKSYGLVFSANAACGAWVKSK